MIPLCDETLDLRIRDLLDVFGIPSFDFDDQQTETVRQQNEVGIAALDNRLIPDAKVIRQQVPKEVEQPFLARARLARAPIPES